MTTMSVKKLWMAIIGFGAGLIMAIMLGAGFISPEAGAAEQANILTFDELSYRKVDGLSFKGVTFDFKIDGVNSSDARYNFLPGSDTGHLPNLAYIQWPALEGNADGTLTLDFAAPISKLEFGVGFSTFDPLMPGFSVQLLDPALKSVGTTAVNTNGQSNVPLPFSEGLFSYNGAPVKRAVLSFNPSFNSTAPFPRFILDNLTYTSSIPEYKPPAIIPPEPIPPASFPAEPEPPVTAPTHTFESGEQITPPVNAITIDFESDQIGYKPNSWMSSESNLVKFSDSLYSAGTDLYVADFDRKTKGKGLAVFADDPSYLIMDFQTKMDFLSLDFGNDNPDWSSPGDTAELTLFQGATPIKTISVVLNRDDIINQTIFYSGVPFDRATFFYNVKTPTPAGTSGLIEMVDNVTFRTASPRPYLHQLRRQVY